MIRSMALLVTVTLLAACSDLNAREPDVSASTAALEKARAANERAVTAVAQAEASKTRADYEAAETALAEAQAAMTRAEVSLRDDSQ